ncbi:hypothetical protein ACFVW9_15010 [Streptomyces sp. NPDC058217]
MADAPPRQVQRRVDPHTADAIAAPPPTPQYAGLFVAPPALPPLDDEPE